MDTQTIAVPQSLDQPNLSTGAELMPAEVAARQERENNSDLEVPELADAEGGYRVSGQGLVNNYAVTPPVYQEQKSLTEKRRDYTMLLIVGGSIVALMLGVIVFVNMTV